MNLVMVGAAQRFSSSEAFVLSDLSGAVLCCSVWFAARLQNESVAEIISLFSTVPADGSRYPNCIW